MRLSRSQQLWEEWDHHEDPAVVPEPVIEVPNNLLRERRRELGMKPREFAEAAGVGYTVYLSFERGESPLSRRHDKVWKPTAQRIADCHGLSPDELWPEAVRKVKQAQVARRGLVSRAAEIAAATMGEPPPLPEEAVRQQKLNTAVADALEGLPPRERMILERRFGFGCPEETLKQVGARIGLSRERIRDLQERALWRFWRPSSPLLEELRLELAERRARAPQSSRPTPPTPPTNVLRYELAERRARALQSSRATPSASPARRLRDDLYSCTYPEPPYERYMALARHLIDLRLLKAPRNEEWLLAELDATWRVMLPDDRERVLQNNPFKEQRHGRQRDRVSVW